MIWFCKGIEVARRIRDEERGGKAKLVIIGKMLKCTTFPVLIKLYKSLQLCPFLLLLEENMRTTKKSNIFYLCLCQRKEET